MNKNNQQEQAPKELNLSTEQPTTEVKKNQQPFKRNTNMTLDPREDHFNQ